MSSPGWRKTRYHKLGKIYMETDAFYINIYVKFLSRDISRERTPCFPPSLVLLVLSGRGGKAYGMPSHVPTARTNPHPKALTL